MVEPVDAPVVEGEGEGVHATEVYPGKFPFAMQLPTVVLTFTGTVMLPTHPGPT